ncbi:MAG: PQQ-like beta-propeller repeat protein [Gemmataceae bacterium]|nr:PQQ-like beta-propeller repeat protein [Gemmataceae bacterium]
MTRSWPPLGPLVLLAALVPAAAQQREPPELPARLPRQQPPVVGPVTTVAPDAGPADDDALRAAGLDPADGPKLVGYLRQRTVSDADRGKIGELIGRLGADRFDDRLAAAAELERYGPAAVGPLKAAGADPDPEVVYRAGQVLKRLETIPHGAVAGAAVRAVMKLKPAGAAGALLGFLPLADSEQLADDIRAALVPLAAPAGKPDPAVVAALADPSAVRRAAASVALVEGGSDKDRIRVKESYEQVKAAVRAEADPEAKFRGLWSLVLTTREKEFVPDLIALTPALAWGRLAQVEDLLLQLAGEHPPGGRFAQGEAARLKARDAWAGWWAAKGGTVELAKLPYQPRVLGFTDLVEQDPQGFGSGRVASVGPDGRERWQLTAARLPNDPGVVRPTDARVLPSGRVLTIESFTQVNERDFSGRLLRQQSLNQARAVQPLPGGGRLVVCRSVVLEYGPDGKEVWRYVRPGAGNDIASGRRLPNGETVLVTIAQQGPNCFRLDGKGKEVGKPLTLGRVSPQQDPLYALDVAGDDRIVLGEPGQVAEYDLTTGKLGWKYPIDRATSVQRLVNGNTLIASLNANRAVEVSPDGEVVWEYKPRDRLAVSRAYRR